jgi:hypothetical protein
MRWQEEVELLQEEMRRILAFLLRQANWWQMQGLRMAGILDAAAQEGAMAYAQRQASLRLALHSQFQKEWEQVPLILQFWEVQEVVE